MLVCREHLKKGLQSLPVPHVKEIPGDTDKSCAFCDKQAALKLFIFNHDQANEWKLTSGKFN